ncbi:hypothetical protein [Nocardioides massiliensis]|uniref:Uncharacterized protein n=1 Tax=Nocardioides massiliensis TaxID=1325935 RepID=A0ABT9NKK2_9ACTN|nr:hypothetical protein [Nocardioides massiliensis]MDP9820942.1 hypothetical protein [Nocardioides massiliensis]
MARSTASGKGSTRSAFDRFADRLMDVDRAYGDERERAVLMEANAFGLSIGIFAALFAALVLAVVGQLLAPLLFVMLAILPASAAGLYARRRQVDAVELAERTGARSTQVATVVIGLLVVLVFAAMAVTVYADGPLVAAPTQRPSEGVWGGMVQGGVVGGMLGGLATAVGGLVTIAKARRAVG